MNLQTSRAEVPARASRAEIARRLTVERHADAQAIEAEWRLLETTGVGTIFQRFDWVDSYVRHVAPHTRTEPAYLLGRLDGRPAFLLPMGVQRHGPARLAHWLGGSHSGYNFGLWSREGVGLVPLLGRAGIRKMLRKALPGVDGAVLQRIPHMHDGVACPLGVLTSQPSAVMGYSVSLEGGMDQVITRTGGGARRRRGLVLAAGSQGGEGQSERGAGEQPTRPPPAARGGVGGHRFPLLRRIPCASRTRQRAWFVNRRGRSCRVWLARCPGNCDGVRERRPDGRAAATCRCRRSRRSGPAGRRAGCAR